MASWRLSNLCETINQAGNKARLDGEDRTVCGVNTLQDAGDGELSFLSNPKYLVFLSKTQASAVVVTEDVEVPDRLSALRCADPYAAITVAIITIHGHRTHPQWGLSERAVIDPSAKIGKNPNIAAGATVSANASVGDDCTLYPGCYVGDGVVMGDGCTLFPNVVVYNDCVLGDRVTIHAGSVVGQDGLGYAPHNGKWFKIPQIGRTIIGDDVEIGANCAIDRATIGQTEIGDGTKFGNVIVIGHGTKIGPDCMFVGLVGVAGSATIGKHVTLSGQVGVAGHITIGDNVRVGAGSSVLSSAKENADLLGAPAIPIEEARRSMIAAQKLPDWIKRIKELEHEIQELRSM